LRAIGKVEERAEGVCGFALADFCPRPEVVAAVAEMAAPGFASWVFLDF
jgi:hypothetical protein